MMKLLATTSLTLLLVASSHVALAQTGLGGQTPIGITRDQAMTEFFKETDNKNKMNGARPEFVSTFSNIQEALTADKLDKAQKLLEKLHKIPKPNKYEESRLYLADYWYQGKLGNKELENDAAMKLLPIGMGNIDADAYVEAGIRLLKRQYNSQNYGGAIETLGYLKKEPKSQPELDAVSTAVKKLEEMESSTSDLVLPIKTNDKGTWMTKLQRPTFFMDKINGEITTIEFNCENKQANMAYKAESVMSTPAAWGSCSIKVNATPNTTFNFVQLVNKPAA